MTNPTPTPPAGAEPSPEAMAARAMHDRRNPAHTKLCIPEAIFREYLADAEVALAPLRAELERVKSRLRLTEQANAGLADECNRLSGEHNRASEVEQLPQLRLELERVKGERDSAQAIIELGKFTATEEPPQIIATTTGEIPKSFKQGMYEAVEMENASLRSDLTAAHTELEGKNAALDKIANFQWDKVATQRDASDSMQRIARSALSGKGEA